MTGVSSADDDRAGSGGPVDVCVVGSANLDLVVHAPRHPEPGETLLGDAYDEFPGGKGLNQAVAAARAGARTAMVGALGADAAGDRLREVLATDRIDHRRVARVDDPTGRALITVSDAAENSIVVVPGANATVVASTLPAAAVVLLQLEVPLVAVESALRLARQQGSRNVLNPAPAAELPDELLANVDVLVPNEHELALLGGVERLLDRGIASLVVTRGAEGVDVIDAAGRSHIDAFPVYPVDTTAAGDSFCGMLCVRLAAGDDLRTAAHWAAAAGALATTRHGAVPSIPTASEVAALMEAAPTV